MWPPRAPEPWFCATGSLRCPQFGSEEECQWSVSRVGGDRNNKAADHNRKCPVHGLLEESPICNTRIHR